MVGMIYKTCTKNYGLGMDAMIYFVQKFTKLSSNFDFSLLLVKKNDTYTKNYNS